MSMCVFVAFSSSSAAAKYNASCFYQRRHCSAVLPVLNGTAAGGRNAFILWNFTALTPCNIAFIVTRETRLVSNIIEQEVPTSENGKSYIRLTLIVFIVHQVQHCTVCVHMLHPSTFVNIVFFERVRY